MGVILCEKSIPRIPEAWKRFFDPDSGKWVFCIEAKLWKFWIFLLKSSFQGLFYAKNRFSASPKRQNASLTIVLEKLFFYHNVSGICWIDLSHKITLRTMISIKIQNFHIFASIHTSISLNQGQGSIFMLRECAESISRIKLPL